MFNKLMKRLNGHGTEPPTLAEALAQLGRDREAVRAEITELNAKRKRALLDDATDAELDKLERQIDRANVRLEKLNIAEQPLREQLAAAQAKARAEAEPGIIAEFHSAFDDYVAGLQVLAEAHRRHTEIRERARAVLGDHRAQVLLPTFVYAGVLTHEHVSDWLSRNRTEISTAAGMRPAPAAPDTRRKWADQAASTRYGARIVSAAPKDGREPTSVGDRHAVAIDTITGRQIGAQVGSRAPRLPDDDGPLAEDQVRVVVLRGGFVGPDGGQSQAGRRLRLERRLALEAAKSGSIEIVEQPVDVGQTAEHPSFRKIDSISDAHGDPTVVSRT